MDEEIQEKRGNKKMASKRHAIFEKEFLQDKAFFDYDEKLFSLIESLANDFN